MHLNEILQNKLIGFLDPPDPPTPHTVALIESVMKSGFKNETNEKSDSKLQKQ